MNCHFHVAEVSPSYISFHLIEAHTVAKAEIPGYDMMICECQYKIQDIYVWDYAVAASDLHPANKVGKV